MQFSRESETFQSNKTLSTLGLWLVLEAWTDCVHGLCGRTGMRGVDGLRPRSGAWTDSVHRLRGRTPSTGLGGVDGLRPRGLGAWTDSVHMAGAWTDSVHALGAWTDSVHGAGVWTDSVHGCWRRGRMSSQTNDSQMID